MLCFTGGNEWKFLAEKLGLTSSEIRFFDKRYDNPAEAMLEHIAGLRPITVGNLYDLLIDCKFPLVADIL